jgi:hypothetical protein
MSGRISRLIKMYGTPTQYKLYKEEIKALVEAKLYDINNFEGNDIDIDSDVIIKLPATFTRIPDIEKCSSYKAKEYLKSRRITQDIINKYNIGYTSWDDPDWYCRNRIVVPSYDEFGDLNYWSARDYSGKAKAKYKNCDIEKTSIIFQESLINWDADIILCEGTLDAIYMDNCISMLGKTMKPDSRLYHMLRERANGKIIICLDADTDISETKKIYNILNMGRLRGMVYYIRLDYLKDFGEVYEKGGKAGMIKILSKMRQFDEIDLII